MAGFLRIGRTCPAGLFLAGLSFATLYVLFAPTAAAQAPDAPIESAWALW